MPFMSTRTVFTSVLIIVSVTACGREPAASGGDTEGPRAAIETQLNQAEVGILLGDIRFVAGRTEAEKGREALSELPLYRALAQVGAITITNEREITPGILADSSVELTRAGVRRIARVAATDKGRSGGIIKKVGAVDELFLHLVPSKLQSIEAKDSLVVGSDLYQTFTGTYLIDVPVELKTALEETRGSMEPERHFKALLKFDRTTGRWVINAIDLARASQAFATNYVDKRIAELRNCPATGCT